MVDDNCLIFIISSSEQQILLKFQELIMSISFSKIAVLAVLSSAVAITTGCATKRTTSEVVVAPLGITRWSSRLQRCRDCRQFKRGYYWC